MAQISKKVTSGFRSDILGTKSVSMRELRVGPMSPREFGTGSVGLNHSGKVSLQCGPAKYDFQVSLNVTLAHSKPEDPKRVSDEIRAAFLAGSPVTLKELGLNDAPAEARIFSSGKVGYYLNGKALVGGHLCQVGCSITAIGSDGDGWADERPTDETEARA